MRKWIFAGLLVLIAGLTMGPHINTSGRCQTGQDCSLGKGEASSISFDTDGADFAIDATGNEATLTATTTATAVFMGADAAGAANTTFSTSGAGTLTLDPEDAGDIIIGSADVTTIVLTNTGAITVGASTTDSISMVTDGGTVTVDGSVLADVPIVTITTATTLTPNTVHLATTDTAVHPVPACVAANLGEWVTVVVGDPSEEIKLSLVDASNRFVVSGIDTGAAAHEIDSPTGAATTGGSFITLTCLVAEFWHSTAIGGIWVDGN